MARRTYFLEPHQDDANLFMAQAIAHHVRAYAAAAAGNEVHIVLMTNGSTSGVLAKLNGLQNDNAGWWGGTHDPAAEGYEPLTAQAFGLARTREWSQSCRLMGVGPTRQHLGMDEAASDLLPTSASIAYAKQVMEYFHNKDIAEGFDAPGFKTMWWGDPNSDHKNIGQAAKELRQTDSRFSDVRWFTKPEQSAEAGATVYPVPAADLDAVKRMQKRGAHPYAAWMPEDGAFAIGMHSVPLYFARVLNGDPNYQVKNI